jgi:hydrogenase maturation protease
MIPKDDLNCDSLSHKKDSSIQAMCQDKRGKWSKYQPRMIMQIAKSVSQADCSHMKMAEPKGLVLISANDSIKGVYAIGDTLLSNLPKFSLENVCCFDGGEPINELARYLSHHKAAIIIDSTRNGKAPGTISIVDLGAMFDRVTPLNIGSCHGRALADELRLLHKSGRLPKRLILFGIEIDICNEDDKIGAILEEKLPQLTKNFTLLVSKILETLKRNA